LGLTKRIFMIRLAVARARKPEISLLHRLTLPLGSSGLAFFTETSGLLYQSALYAKRQGFSWF
ncbi:MAG: hypothetical protein WCF13_11595, partial [Stellaceae bacterium]